MKTVTLYATDHCPYCINARALLARKGVTPVEIDVASSPQALAQMMARTRRRTVPQIYIGERHVGGFDDLAALERRGELDDLLRR